MVDPDQSELFRFLKKSIENQLEWGETSGWSTADFERLSEKIQRETGVLLSVSTLKRVFGRVDYQSTPAITTLNTMAQFIGYEDWRSFRNVCLQKRSLQDDAPKKAVFENLVARGKKYEYLFFKLVLAVVMLASMGFFANRFILKKHEVNNADFHFSSKTMLTQGLPNSVVFDYDASAANKEDAIFIAQSWDTSRKIQVDRDGKHHSAIYYYPGYFRAKLMIGNKIVREHDIQIKTDGWLGLVEGDGGKEPLYFRKSDIMKSDEIAVSESLLKSYKMDFLHGALPIRLYNQKDKTGIMTNNFSFETDVKTGPSTAGDMCQRVEILLQSKNDIIIVPLVNTACIGDIALTAGSFYTDSKRDDLSGFGCNLLSWNKLKIDCKNRQIRFWINHKLVYSTMIKNAPTEIVGVQYRFKRAGFVRNTRLRGLGNRETIF